MPKTLIIHLKAINKYCTLANLLILDIKKYVDKKTEIDQAQCL